MIINNIVFSLNGYINCTSCFYSAQDMLDYNSIFRLSNGVNKLYGDIDCGVWAVSYCLSMYIHRPQNFTIADKPYLLVDNREMTLSELNKFSCYMDDSFPVFHTSKSTKKLVALALKKSNTDLSLDEIKDIFQLDNQRFERPLSCIGNEVFRAMAAIGYATGKEIFCFPWLSQKRLDYYHNNITKLLEILSDLNKIVVLPLGTNSTKTFDGSAS